MNKNILAFGYLASAGGEQSVIRIDPQSASTKQKDSYNPIFPKTRI